MRVIVQAATVLSRLACIALGESCQALGGQRQPSRCQTRKTHQRLPLSQRGATYPTGLAALHATPS
jgi:hypothetical protein